MKLKKEKESKKASDSEVRSGGASPRTSKRAKIIKTIKRERERERKGEENHFKKDKKKRERRNILNRFIQKCKIKFENTKDKRH
jgi:hypothetical protein